MGWGAVKRKVRSGGRAAKDSGTKERKREAKEKIGNKKKKKEKVIDYVSGREWASISLVWG